LTELPVAFVVLKDGVANGKWEVRRLLKEVHVSVDGLVSGYKKLRGGVWEVTALPKNATGKFVRKELGRHKTRLSSLDEVEERARL
jgi:4-coumarate--CoA ligase